MFSNFFLISNFFLFYLSCLNIYFLIFQLITITENPKIQNLVNLSSPEFLKEIILIMYINNKKKTK